MGDRHSGQCTIVQRVFDCLIALAAQFQPGLAICLSDSVTRGVVSLDSFDLCEKPFASFAESSSRAPHIWIKAANVLASTILVLGQLNEASERARDRFHDAKPICRTQSLAVTWTPAANGFPGWRPYPQ